MASAAPTYISPAAAAMAGGAAGASVAPPANDAAGEAAIEQWKIKKLIKSLEQARGYA